MNKLDFITFSSHTIRNFRTFFLVCSIVHTTHIDEILVNKNRKKNENPLFSQSYTQKCHYIVARNVTQSEGEQL